VVDEIGPQGAGSHIPSTLTVDAVVDDDAGGEIGVLTMSMTHTVETITPELCDAVVEIVGK
jgi:hypothetical protein